MEQTSGEQTSRFPTQLYYRGKTNMYRLHEVFCRVATIVRERINAERHVDIPITSGLWGGGYLVCNPQGEVLSRVIRFYSIVNLPQNSLLDEPKNFEYLMKIYCQTCRDVFRVYYLEFEKPQWGERIPYTNKIRPNISMQMWERDTEVQFMRAFFVWNTATWEESLIFDTLRNIKQLKELLDVSRWPTNKAKEELRFALQDILIVYHTLHNALTPDFLEHARPYMQELLGHFLEGLHDRDLVNDLFYRAYSNLYVYGFEEALDVHYKQHDLDIRRVEDWPVEKINWVPEELKEKLIHPLRQTFLRFKNNLEGENLGQNCSYLSLYS